jgi:hypothetical protein
MSHSTLFLLIAVPFGFLAAATFGWLVIRLLENASSEMRCGHCTYPTKGIESLTCPECGADLRMAGIVKGRPVNPGVLILLTALATASMLVALFFISLCRFY